MRSNRIVEVAGVNEVRSLLEAEGHIFQTINLENDIGKDAYVDFLSPDGSYVASMAIQVKSGASYRRAKGYAIPASARHRQLWAASAVPVLGIVFDKQRQYLGWCDLTAACRNRDPKVGPIPVPLRNTLTSESLAAELIPYVARRQQAPSLGLYDPDEATQVAAVWDHFALGRGDRRAFLLIRDACRSLRGNGLRAALFALAHLSPHPDIWWNESNVVPDGVRAFVSPLLCWPSDDIAHFLNILELEEFARASSGLDLMLLLQCDPDAMPKLIDIAKGVVSRATDHATVAATLILLDFVSRDQDEPLALFDALVNLNPELGNDKFLQEIRNHLVEHGSLFLI